jgi:hypothetical protein
VKCDTSIKEIRENRVYPLNQAQISQFTESLMLKHCNNGGRISAWDLYNSATDLYKADTMDIPQIMPQNRAFVSFLDEQFNLQ